MNGAPMQWRSGGDKARRACPGLDPGVARRDASQLAASPGMDCQPTPESLREVAGQDARRPLHRGGLLFGYFLLATQEKVTRSPQASESLGLDAHISRREAMHEAKPEPSHWVPACAGTTMWNSETCRKASRLKALLQWNRSEPGIAVNRESQ